MSGNRNPVTYSENLPHLGQRLPVRPRVEPEPARRVPHRRQLGLLPSHRHVQGHRHSSDITVNSGGGTTRLRMAAAPRHSPQPHPGATATTSPWPSPARTPGQ
jgi:hypothetical protein